jgi:integrase
MVDSCSSRNRDRDKALVLLQVDTGVRRYELIALNIRDVDLVTNAARIISGKGGKNRTVNFGNKNKQKLQKYLRTQNSLRLNTTLFSIMENIDLVYGDCDRLLEEELGMLTFKIQDCMILGDVLRTNVYEMVFNLDH